MPRRPAFLPATAALCALTALTACQGSPEAGHPNTTPPASGASTSTPPPSPSKPSTPAWTSAELAAVTAATARYTGARAAVAVALHDPENADREVLVAKGNGGAWLDSIVQHIIYLRDRNLYQTGDPKLSSISPVSIDLRAAQPAVVLRACLDGSSAQMRYRKTGKPVPVATVAGNSRHTINARLIYVPSKTGDKAWLLVEEKVLGTC